MDVRSIQSGGTPGVKNGPAAKPAQGAGDALLGGVSKNDFLKLLVAQLRNQDPMKPMEDREFITQMAQLNTVEQIASMNTQLTELLSAEAVSQASALIGKNVESALEDGSTSRGIVEEVRLEQRIPTLIVGGRRIGLWEITRITPGA